MRKSILVLSAFGIVLVHATNSHATFSIVAVDTVTGTVGSAGASCIAGSQIINDVVEGIGAVNTQSFYLSGNQSNAHTLLLAGIMPDSIMAWLEANDVEGDPTVRQYGAVTIAGPGASASFTGGNCFFWAGHLVGPTYAVQGNILLGPEIIDSMEFVFLNTSGPLEEKLMAALEAAKVPGADSRCLSAGKSSISAYIKVVRLGDGGVPYLYEAVGNTTPSVDPIDVLRTQYDNWKLAQQANADSSELNVTPLQQRADGTSLVNITIVPINHENDTVRYPDDATVSHTGSGTLSAVVYNGNKTFSATLTAPSIGERDTLTATVDAGGLNVQLTARPEVIFYPCGDINGNLTGLNIVDLNFLVNRIFRSGPPPPFPPAADINGDATNGNILDLNRLVNYIFRSIPKPDCGW